MWLLADPLTFQAMDVYFLINLKKNVIKTVLGRAAT
jgi:hypothetical protein